MTETLEGPPEHPHTAHDHDPLLHFKSGLSGFLTEFDAFQDDVTTKLKKQEERIAMLTKKSRAHARPPLSA